MSKNPWLGHQYKDLLRIYGVFVSVYKTRLRGLTNLVVQKICPLLPMVLSHRMTLPIQAQNLLPGALLKNETSYIVLRTLGPLNSVFVDLLSEDVVARIIRDGLRWHGKTRSGSKERDTWVPSKAT